MSLVHLNVQDYPDTGPAAGEQEVESSLDCSKRNSMPAVPVSANSTATNLDTARRPSSLEVPSSSNHMSRHLEPNDQRERSTSRSVSPAPYGERKANITVPKLDSTAQALLAAMEARPKSPLLAEDLQHIFDHLPSGCVQVCIHYYK